MKESLRRVAEATLAGLLVVMLVWSFANLQKTQKDATSSGRQTKEAVRPLKVASFVQVDDRTGR